MILRAERETTGARPKWGAAPARAGDNGPRMIADDLRALVVPLEQLVSLEGNPRQGDVEAVARSYERFGQRKPVVARRRPDGRGEVTAGNTQLAAARQLGWPGLAVVWADDDDDTARAWALADNRTSDLGIYDEAALAAYLQSVRLTGDDDLFAATGYDVDDLARLLARQGLTRDDDVVPPPPARFRELGDTWRLGPHRLVCGDATVVGPVAAAMDGARASLVYTDPPYGVSYTGGSKRQAMLANDNATGAELAALFAAPFVAAAAVGANACAVFVWYGRAAAPVLSKAAAEHGWEERSRIIWLKDHAQYGRRWSQHYHELHEFGHVLRAPGPPVPVARGRHGGQRVGSATGAGERVAPDAEAGRAGRAGDPKSHVAGQRRARPVRRQRLEH